MKSLRYCVFLLVFMLPSALASDESNNRVSQAQADLLAGKVKKASLGFAYAVNQNASDVLAQIGLAESQFILQRFAQAEQHAKAVLSINATYGRALTLMGRIRLQQERYDEARQYLIRAVSADSSNGDALLSLGDAQTRVGDKEAADLSFAAYQRLIQKN